MNKIKILIGYIFAIIFFSLALCSFIIYVISESLIERILSAVICFFSIAAAGIVVQFAKNIMSIRKSMAWISTITGLTVLGFSLISYSQSGYSHFTLKQILIFIAPFPAFTLITWGSYYLVTGTEKIIKLRIYPAVIWLYLGISGGMLTFWFIYPWDRITIFKQNPFLTYFILAALVFFLILMPVIFFLGMKKNNF